MLENIALSFQSVWAHKIRSILTMLGIIIGIASIITIVSTIKGTNEQIKQNLVGSGVNAVVVQLYQQDYPYDLTWQATPDNVAVITEETRREIEALESVREASLFQKQDYANNVYYQNTAFSGSLVGADSHYLSVYNYNITWGRGFLQSDFDELRKVAVVDRAAWTGTATFPDGTTTALQNSNGHFLPLRMAPGASCTIAVSGPGLLPGRTVILSCSCGGLVEGAVSAEVAVDASGVLRFAYRSGTFGSQPIEATLMGQRRPLLTVHAVQTRPATIPAAPEKEDAP